MGTSSRQVRLSASKANVNKSGSIFSYRYKPIAIVYVRHLLGQEKGTR